MDFMKRARWKLQQYTARPKTGRYEVWQKINATGNSVHEPTTLLLPPSHDS
jgi:hypothetical protein